MPVLHLLCLPVDIVERLIVYSPDYGCLWAFVTTGKTLYGLFHSRRDYYMNAIGENQVGEALYYARYLCRYMSIDWIDHQDLELRTVDRFENMPVMKGTLLPAGTHWTDQPPILFSEGRIITAIAKVLRGWEAHYSNYYKDRTSRSSKLTALEAFRFSRALCRLWAFINHWHCDPNSYEGRPKPPFHYALNNREALGNETLDAGEVCELRDVWLFFGEVVGWMNASCGYADFKPRRSAVFNQSPKALLRYFNEQDVAWPSQRWISCVEQANTVLTNLCRAREVPIGTHGQPLSVLIKDRIEKRQECDHCKTAKAELWGQSNWHWLRGYFPPQRLAEFLSLDRTDTMDVRDHLHRPHSYPIFLRKLINMQTRADASGPQWTLDEWICTDCLKILIKENISPWLKAHFKSAKPKSESVKESTTGNVVSTTDGPVDNDLSRSCTDLTIKDNDDKSKNNSRNLRSRRKRPSSPRPRRKGVGLSSLNSSTGMERKPLCPDDWSFSLANSTHTVS